MNQAENGLPRQQEGTRTEIFAWAMYDWANSAYSTLSITILFAYLTMIVVPGARGPVVWAWGISLSMLTAAILSPILGAVADANASKRKWLALTAMLGATSAVFMAMLPSSATWTIVALFVIASLFFELSLGFYNGFLPEITTQETINRVSAWGYALGYLGGALALILVLVVQSFAPRMGLDAAVALRVGIAIMGLWWGVFTLPTLWGLRDRATPPEQSLPMRLTMQKAVGKVAKSLKNIRRYKILALFLLGFLFYNDGIQTVISQSSTLATKKFDFKPADLALLVLMIQFLALPGALLIGYLADRIGQKATLMLCLAIWVGLVVAAYLIQSPGQFWILGAVLALVMGGTQSVSRAIMGRMTPPEHTAEFFGFFNLSGKATSFLGTFLFGLIIYITGSAEMAILSLLIFFLIGWAIVASIPIEKGRHQASES